MFSINIAQYVTPPRSPVLPFNMQSRYAYLQYRVKGLAGARKYVQRWMFLKMPYASKGFDFEFPTIKTTKLLVEIRLCTRAERVYL